ncbi:hypothetical protein D3C72_1810280 [compost metagenome]
MLGAIGLRGIVEADHQRALFLGHRLDGFLERLAILIRPGGGAGSRQHEAAFLVVVLAVVLSSVGREKTEVDGAAIIKLEAEVGE